MQNGAEGLLESIGLLLEQLETFLSTNSLGLVKLQIPISTKQNEIERQDFQSVYILEGRTCVIFFYFNSLLKSKNTLKERPLPALVPVGTGHCMLRETV